jgi:hypothetical protein
MEDRGTPRPGLFFCEPLHFTKLSAWDLQVSRIRCIGLRSVTAWTFVARLRWSLAGLTR